MTLLEGYVLDSCNYFQFLVDCQIIVAFTIKYSRGQNKVYIPFLKKLW